MSGSLFIAMPGNDAMTRGLAETLDGDLGRLEPDARAHRRHHRGRATRQRRTPRSPICVAVHGLFADNSHIVLAQAGARIVSSNSIPHETNAIDVTELLAQAVGELPQPRGARTQGA